MTTLTDIQIGSIVSGMVDNIPAGISGLLTTIVDQQIYFAEQFTGDSIGTTAVVTTYQPAIISLSTANVLELMEAQGLGTKSVSIGELKISKGMVEGTSKSLKQDGLSKLKEIGQHMSYYQTWS